MRYAIIENEYFALENLRRLVEHVSPGSRLVFSSESVRESVEYFRTGATPDLVFLDIERVDGNCFQIMEQATISSPVIFTTAYDHYALEAFRLDTVDYLLKPVSEQALRRALDRFSRRQVAAPDQDLAQRILSRLEGRSAYPSRVLVSQREGYSFVDTDDIAYIYAEDKCVFLADRQGRDHITMYSSLARAEDELDPARFFRISRKVIAAIGAVGKVSRHLGGRLSIQFRTAGSPRRETVSPSLRAEFLQWLGASG